MFLKIVVVGERFFCRKPVETLYGFEKRVFKTCIKHVRKLNCFVLVQSFVQNFSTVI